jgi:hypothetical protein
VVRQGRKITSGEAASVSRCEGQGLEAAEGAEGLVRYVVSLKAMGVGRDGATVSATEARGKKAVGQGGSGRGARRSSSQVRSWLMSDVLLRLPRLGRQGRHDEAHGGRLGRPVLHQMSGGASVRPQRDRGALTVAVESCSGHLSGRGRVGLKARWSRARTGGGRKALGLRPQRTSGATMPPLNPEALVATELR